MTAQSTTGAMLPMAAALHVFLAQHPELSALPVWWMVDHEDGISMGMRTRPDADEVVTAVASALGLEVDRHDSSGPKAGASRLVSAKGTLHGLPIFIAGRLPLPAEDTAQ